MLLGERGADGRGRRSPRRRATAPRRRGRRRTRSTSTACSRRFGSWYELFPRSWGGFAGVRELLPRFAELGFDVLYLPPIHPIGHTNRKGRNNARDGEARRRRQPVGDRLRGGRARRDRPVARHRAGASRARRRREGARDRDRARLRDPVLARPPVAEGASGVVPPPPRRDAEVRREPAEALPGHLQRRLRLRGLARPLAGAARRRPPLGRRGVTVFRVDNPHTKPVPFWEWLIAEVRREHPEVIFLAEAFTRPAMMTTLAKAGFAQSYTYFTWKNTRWELLEFLGQLLDWREFYRPNCFANTPDILHEYLQAGGRPAFEARLVLAATLSPSYGIYSGFEHCENVPVRPGSEEYLNSEKYELKQRTLDGPLLPLVAHAERRAAREPGAAVARSAHVPRDRERAASSPSSSGAATTPSSSSSTSTRRRRRTASASCPSRPGCRRRTRCATCSRTRVGRGASAATTSSSPRADAHHPRARPPIPVDRPSQARPSPGSDDAR